MELKKERMEYNLAQSWVKSMQNYIILKHKEDTTILDKCLEALKEIHLIDKYGTEYYWDIGFMDFCIEETDGIDYVKHTFKNLCDTGNKDISERITLYYFDMIDLDSILNTDKLSTCEKITKLNYIDILKDIEAVIKNHQKEIESKELVIIYKIRDDKGRTWEYDSTVGTFCMKDKVMPGQVFIEDEYTQIELLNLDVEVVEKALRDYGVHAVKNMMMDMDVDISYLYAKLTTLRNIINNTNDMINETLEDIINLVDRNREEED